jgi:hypothetical protein
MKNNEAKFRQSHHRPFFHDPLNEISAFKGSHLKHQGSWRVYMNVMKQLQKPKQLLEALAMPSSIRTSGTQSMDISLDSYRSFWRKAKEATSSYPGSI